MLIVIHGLISYDSRFIHLLPIISNLLELLLIPSISQSVHLGGLSVALLIGSHQLPIRLYLFLSH